MDQLSEFEHLILPHMDAAYNLARWMLRNEQDAEDSVQEATLRAYRAFGAFRGDNGKAWLLTIVRNVCLSLLKKHQKSELGEPFDEAFHGVVDEPLNNGHLELQQIRREWLEHGLEQLPLEFREVIVLHELEGMAYKDISATVGIPIGTVMSRLARARRKLHLELMELSKKEASRGM
ncbi:MAG: sigma-70 family RNA polymerase sigma factor [Methylacidiphilales bacterium]|nr:sigma-70 family RNA polymerase sigma factor [Candidatus Methylacidiphilales bacterium]